MASDPHYLPGLGRRYAPDARDRRYPMRAAMAPAIPRTYRFWLPPDMILDQAQTPMCVGFAWAHFLACSPLRTLTGPGPELIYARALGVDEWPGENYAGTSVRAGAKIIQEAGHVIEYLWATDAATVRDWILAHGPVVLGTDWTWRMFEPDAQGMVRPLGGFAGGHAYLATGFSAKRQAFRIVNSWGPAWGQQGRAWIGFEDLDALIRNMGEACTAVEVARI